MITEITVHLPCFATGDPAKIQAQLVSLRLSSQFSGLVMFRYRLLDVSGIMLVSHAGSCFGCWLEKMKKINLKLAYELCEETNVQYIWTIGHSYS